MDFKTLVAQNFNGDEEKAHQHLVNESYYGDYSITGSRENLKTILDTMTREEAKVYMRCFRDTVKKDKMRTKDENAWSSKWLLVFPCFFLALAIWMFITGCSNVLQMNELNKTGVQVQVTVTNKRIDSSGENTANYYTFSYEVDNITYEFTDSPDREYKVGETFTAHVDPNNPQNMVLPNSDLTFAFMLLIFSGGSLFIYEGCRSLAKYIPHALVVWASAMIITGFLLPNTTACVLGVIFLVAILAVWMLVCKKKKAVV